MATHRRAPTPCFASVAGNTSRWLSIVTLLSSALACGGQTNDTLGAKQLAARSETPRLIVPPRRPRSVTKDVLYFVMPDRFANGDRSNDLGDYVPGKEDPKSDDAVLKHGYLPTNKAYYHGGDLAGLERKLAYVKSLGATAIWVTPIFRNKPVQGDGTIGGSASAYHGYWIIDFLGVDRHLAPRPTSSG
jgi:hypothetical protein